MEQWLQKLNEFCVCQEKGHYFKIEFFAHSTVAKKAWFCLMFTGNDWFWCNWVHFDKMSLNSAKIVSIPRVSIHNWSFKPKLTRIIKKLVLKIFRQNLKIWLFSWIKNRHIFEFCPKILRTNTSQLRLKWSIMNRNSWDWDYFLHF